MNAFDLILFILLLVGNVLGLPIWRAMFGAPWVRFWKRLRRLRLHTV